jgi:hypothetical protein
MYDSYVYVLIEREFINSGENVFKIGKTTDILSRMKGYPKGSKLVCLMNCENHNESELQLKTAFKKAFKHRGDIGHEYFEGNKLEIINVFMENCVTLNTCDGDIDNIEDTQCDESFKCEYCHSVLCRRYRLTTHVDKCKMKDDEVRNLEIQLNKKVILDPKSYTCRFCKKELCSIQTLHKHDAICEAKQEYKELLMKEMKINAKYKCEYCHLTCSRGDKLKEHKNICKMKDDELRQLEMQLCKEVVLEPKCSKCRFCNIEFGRVWSLHRHDKICKAKQEYKEGLLKEINKKEVKVCNWDRSYEHISDEDVLSTCVGNKTMNDMPIMIEKFFRMAHEGDKSIRVTNMKSNEAKTMYDDNYITADIRQVTQHKFMQAICRYKDVSEKGEHKEFIDMFNFENIDMDQRLRRCMRMCKTAIKRVFYDETRKRIA